jgi:hypothetical protein
MISINDYNRNLSGDTFFQNLYQNKKLSILNSKYNDQVISVKQSGTSVSYLNELKLNGNQNQLFTLKTQFFTERPKILQNDVVLIDNQYINLGKFCYLLEPQLIYTSGGTNYQKKEIIFQDENGNELFSSYTFIIDSILDTKDLGNKVLTFKSYIKMEQSYRRYNSSSNLTKTTQWNTIQFNGVSTIRTGDIIRLSGFTNDSLMNNREFKISNTSYNKSINTTTLFTPDYIINESGKTYNIQQKLQPYQITSAAYTASGDITDFIGVVQKNAYCYLTTNLLYFTMYYQSGITNTIDAFINKFKNALYQYGMDIYYTEKNNYDYLSIESLYGSKSTYFNISGYTNNTKITDDFSLSNNGLTTRYDIITNEKLISETTNKSNTTELYQSSIATEVVLRLNNDNDRFGFKLILNDIEYYINYSGNTQTTINKFIDTWGTILNGNGFTLSSGYSSLYTGYTLVITSDVDIWDIEVIVNILSSYQIIEYRRNNAILLSGNQIKTTNNLYDIGLATGMIIKVSGSTYNQNNKEYNILGLTNNIIDLSYQGSFQSESGAYIYCKSREFIRKPRGEYNRDIYFRVFWEIPYDGIVDESIFLYDISGEQLTPYNNNSNLTYIGQKPLIDLSTNNVVLLNKNPNKDLSKVSDPKYQQTIFDELNFKLEQLDSSENYNWIPEPLEIFIGYNSINEGVNNRILKIEKIEKKENSNDLFFYSGYTDSGSSISVNNFKFYDSVVEYITPIDFSFISYGFEKDQLIKFYFKDQSKTDQKIFENVYTYKIADVARQKLIIDTTYTSGATGFTYFITTGTTFYFKIEVQPKEILSCVIYGQTEIEDLRYKVNLNNLGIQLEEDAYKILYLSDIEDNAVDYTLFNRKRKEMLTNYREIYDYIGSYKALINAINFFGFNDLQLFEYYRNIDRHSMLYGKLHKVLIPDIFDNTVEGWNEMDFIAGKYQNQYTWKKTNLFNLAYKITDNDGNNVLIYSLDEIQQKLGGLKKWLRRNILPISSNLTDITGLSETKSTLYQEYDESNQTKKAVVERDSLVVNFNYTATLNFGSDYLITVNFYVLSGGTGSDITYKVPESFSAKIKTFYLSGDTMIPVQ